MADSVSDDGDLCIADDDVEDAPPFTGTPVNRQMSLGFGPTDTPVTKDTNFNQVWAAELKKQVKYDDPDELEKMVKAQLKIVIRMPRRLVVVK